MRDLDVVFAIQDFTHIDRCLFSSAHGELIERLRYKNTRYLRRIHLEIKPKKPKTANKTIKLFITSTTTTTRKSYAYFLCATSVKDE